MLTADLSSSRMTPLLLAFKLKRLPEPRGAGVPPRADAEDASTTETSSEMSHRPRSEAAPPASNAKVSARGRAVGRTPEEARTSSFKRFLLRRRSASNVAASAGDQQAPPNPPTSAVCPIEGCANHFAFFTLQGIRQLRKRHYCGGCQRWVCYDHTRIAPHGKRGVCSLHSHCLCTECFGALPPEQRLARRRSNHPSVEGRWHG